MSLFPNFQPSERFQQELADSMQAWQDEQDALKASSEAECNRVQAFIKSLRIDTAMADAVLAALLYAAQRDGVLCSADLSMLDEAYCFVGGH